MMFTKMAKGIAASVVAFLGVTVISTALIAQVISLGPLSWLVAALPALLLGYVAASVTWALAAAWIFSDVEKGFEKFNL